MGNRARRKRIYRVLGAEGISKKKATSAAKLLARHPTARPKKSKLAALGNKAKTIKTSPTKLAPHRRAPTRTWPTV